LASDNTNPHRPVAAGWYREWAPGDPMPEVPAPAEPDGTFWLGMHTRDEANPKDLIGVRKPQLHLVPPAANIAEAVVFGLGAKKYGAYNWRTKKVRATVYVSAALRHISSYLDGDDTDPESGQSHLAHARACTAILLDALATGNLVDDRPAKGVAARLIKELTETA
jgi:hypothetical protein